MIGITIGTTPIGSLNNGYYSVMATRLTSAASIRANCNLPENVTDQILEPHIKKAVAELTRTFGAELYSTIANESQALRRWLECEQAEALLAMSYAVYALNTETQGEGIVRVKGFDQNRSELLGQGELDSLSNRYREEAMALLRPHLPVDDEEELYPSYNGGGFTMAVA